jgi:hypothetical protein
MLGAERRELDVLPDELRHRRPVVGEPDLSLGRTERRKVVTPDPAATLQLTVAFVLPGQSSHLGPPAGAEGGQLVRGESRDAAAVGASWRRLSLISGAALLPAARMHQLVTGRCGGELRRAVRRRHNSPRLPVID